MHPVTPSFTKVFALLGKAAKAPLTTSCPWICRPNRLKTLIGNFGNSKVNVCIRPRCRRPVCGAFAGGPGMWMKSAADWPDLGAACGKC